MNNNTDQRLLDHIYAAAWDPGALEEALRALADTCRSRSAGLFHLRNGALVWEQSWNMPDGFMADFATNTAARDPRVHFGLSQPPLTLMRDDEPTMRRAMCDAGVDGFARDYDLPYTLSCTLDRSTPTDAVALYVSRSNEEGRPDAPQVDAFARYAPHFARTMALRQRVRADLAINTAARIDAGAQAPGLLGLDHQNRVRWMDGEAERFLNASEGVCLHTARLHFASHTDSHCFGRLVRDIERGAIAQDLRMGIAQRQPPGWLWLRPMRNPLPQYAARVPVLVVLRRHECDTTPEPSGLPIMPTPRQLQVLSLLAEGLMSKQIGARLGIAENTVRNHIQQLLRTLQVPTRTACVARARACGLLDRNLSTVGPDTW